MAPEQPAAPRLEVEHKGGVTVVRFTRADMRTGEAVEGLRDEILGLIKGSAPPRLVIDFGRVQFFGNQVMAWMALLHKKAAAASGGVVLCGLNPYLAGLFKITCLDRAVTIRRDEGEALQNFGPAPPAPQR